MKKIGLDLSINSTGICIITPHRKPKYYIIASDKMTKKRQELARNLCDAPLKYYIYNYCGASDASYSDKERIKTENIKKILDCIEVILKKEKPTEAFIEGVSLGSVGSAALVDLSGLNFAVRYLLQLYNIPFTIVAPTELKKLACGNGSADKEEMMWAWEHCDDRLVSLKDRLKFDDIADAYFLANVSN